MAAAPLPASIRVLVADDHPAVRTGFVAFLDSEEDFDVVGEARNGAEAVELSWTLWPDVVLMDVRMPVLDGIGATTLIKGASPAIRVVLITAYEQLELTVAGRECGADAFVCKGISGAELTERLRAAVFSPRPVEAA